MARRTMRSAISPLAPRGLALVAATLLCSAGFGCAALPDEAPLQGEESSERDQAVGSGRRFTLWIHGRSPGGSQQEAKYDDFSYWGPADVEAGVEKRAVNWEGGGRISETNFRIRDALDCFCTGENWCYVAVHSAGNAQIGYALDLFGGTDREIKDATPDASGACGSVGGTQRGWNVKWVDVAGGAAGGTELANMGHWAVSDPLTGDLRTGTVRTMYNHNNTAGAMFYLFPGAKGTLYSGVLPGQDDEVIAYHSAGGLSGTGSFCNPGNWFCDGSLMLGSQASTKGGKAVPKWSNHEVLLRDDREERDHYANGAWAGVIAPMRDDVVEYAY